MPVATRVAPWWCHTVVWLQCAGAASTSAVAAAARQGVRARRHHVPPAGRNSPYGEHTPGVCSYTSVLVSVNDVVECRRAPVRCQPAPERCQAANTLPLCCSGVNCASFYLELRASNCGITRRPTYNLHGARMFLSLVVAVWDLAACRGDALCRPLAHNLGATGGHHAPPSAHVACRNSSRVQHSLRAFPDSCGVSRPSLGVRRRTALHACVLWCAESCAYRWRQPRLAAIRQLSRVAPMHHHRSMLIVV